MVQTVAQTLEWRYLQPNDPCGVVVQRMAPQYPLGPHDHVFNEIAFVEAGSGEHHTADGIRPLRPGDLILIRPQVWHAYQNTKGLTILNCLFEPATIRKLTPIIEHLDGAFGLFIRRLPKPKETAPTVLHTTPAQRGLFLLPLQRIMDEQREHRNGWPAAAMSALLDLLIHTCRLASDSAGIAPPIPQGRTQAAVLDAAGYLESHYTQTIALSALAARVHLSPSHLSRHFGKVMGMGIVDYLHRIRCEEACRLLRYTELSVKEVAAKLGYSEIAYFSRCFTQQIGRSPRAYRQEQQHLH